MPRHTHKPGSKQQRKRPIPKLRLNRLARLNNKAKPISKSGELKP